MTVYNADIAAKFNRTADLLELQEANPFRIRAYRQAARTINELPKSLASMLKEGEDLSELPHIGKDLAGKIADIVNTRHFNVLDELEKEIPPGLVDLLYVEGLGPKRVSALYKYLDIKNPGDLRRAAMSGKIQELPRFSDKIVQKIVHALDARGTQEKRSKWVRAEEIASSMIARLKKIKGVKQVIAAGSYRRKQETVGDLDILVTCSKGASVIDHFVKYEDVAEVVSQGTTRSTVILDNGFQIDLRVVPEISYGAALHYFTGSKAHNITVREMGVKRGLKINEYGVFKGEKRIAGRTEEEVYKQVGLPYIEPELREKRGELKAAKKGSLPRLIDIKDIRGDLHSHTDATDGRATLQEMAEAAKKRGYEYFAITDHSQHLTVASGLDEKRLRKQCAQIDRLNEKLKGITILKSIEVDILSDGSLDLPDSALKDLDLTVCAVHYKFDLPAEKQTERIIRAMDNIHFNILAHPTGRLIGERGAYRLDMERIIKAARERGCILEVNSQPERLDLNDINCRMAKEAGVRLAISTDAHTTDQLDFMRLGIAQARRGWIEAIEVINTLPLEKLKKTLKRS